MGLKDFAAKAQAEAEAKKVAAADEDQVQRAAASRMTAACPGGHYVTEVNRGSINMGRWQHHLNDMYGKGYRLAHVLEQDGNTVQVYEHHFH